ncbi:MAG TPA: glycoside hydrolase family 36 protein, partial [Terriglobales bacterium]|nr:glycoside hydrolase family 36 protein [Terriglobales bacterium]
SLLGCASLLIIASCGRSVTPSAAPARSAIEADISAAAVTLTTSTARFQLSPAGYMTASLLSNGRALTLDDPNPDSRGDSLISGGKPIADFQLNLADAKVADGAARLGPRGKTVQISARSASFPSLQETLTIEVADDLPNLVFTTATYKNTGTSPLRLDQVVIQQHRLSASRVDEQAKPWQMWSFSGASEQWGKDDVMPVSSAFSRANVMETVMHNDENSTGGGVPVVAFWTRSLGEAIGHVEVLPWVMSLPVRTEPDGRVSASLTLQPDQQLKPGETYSTPLSFVAVFRGDFYQPLHLYSTVLQREGWTLPSATKGDYQPNWCGWGYELNVTPKQMLGTIPKLRQLGFHWATLDAGWFNNRGDWQPNPKTFPDDSIRKVVDAYHQAGIHITLWWIPLVVEDGEGKDILNNRPYKLSEVVKQHPGWLILDKNGKHARATADMGALCPAVPAVQQYYKQLTEKFIRDWGFDGSKLDFSYIVPPCYNPKHHHKSPMDSVRAMSEIYKVIFQTTRALKPDSVTQSCPCGTPPNMAWLPFIDQAVTADPVGSRQVRLRTKMYKALLGPQAAVYGDHVELTKINFANSDHEVDVGRDFASTIGTGAVLGTKFTWPDYGPKFKTVELTPQKESYWKKWIDIYNSKMLSRGEFLDLYTYGYDVPEGYAIAKDGKMYYAFYAPEGSRTWSGEIDLRGLPPGTYQVVDYEHAKSLGTVDSRNPKLKVSFDEHLLLEASRR